MTITWINVVFAAIICFSIITVSLVIFFIVKSKKNLKLDYKNKSLEIKSDSSQEKIIVSKSSLIMKFEGIKKLLAELHHLQDKISKEKKKIIYRKHEIYANELLYKMLEHFNFDESDSHFDDIEKICFSIKKKINKKMFYYAYVNHYHEKRDDDWKKYKNDIFKIIFGLIRREIRILIGNIYNKCGDNLSDMSEKEMIVLLNKRICEDVREYSSILLEDLRMVSFKNYTQFQKIEEDIKSLETM